MNLLFLPSPLSLLLVSLLPTPPPRHFLKHSQPSSLDPPNRRSGYSMPVRAHASALTYPHTHAPPSLLRGSPRRIKSIRPPFLFRHRNNSRSRFNVLLLVALSLAIDFGAFPLSLLSLLTRSAKWYPLVFPCTLGITLGIGRLRERDLGSHRPNIEEATPSYLNEERSRQARTVIITGSTLIAMRSYKRTRNQAQVGDGS